MQHLPHDDVIKLFVNGLKEVVLMQILRLMEKKMRYAVNDHLNNQTKPKALDVHEDFFEIYQAQIGCQKRYKKSHCYLINS